MRILRRDTRFEPAQRDAARLVGDTEQAFPPVSFATSPANCATLDGVPRREGSMGKQAATLGELKGSGYEVFSSFMTTVWKLHAVNFYLIYP